MKNIIIILITIMIFILIILSVIYFNRKLTKKKIDVENISKPKDETINNENIDNNEEQKVKQDLNRVTYKEGFYYEEIGEEIKERITGFSFPNEFDNRYHTISYEDLRYINIKHYDFSGNVQQGELIVHKGVAEEIVKIFYELYEVKYKINKMVLIDEYNGDDELSMEDNNTSAFNYRVVQNSETLSWHAFGLAIDINPLNNPYIKGNNVSPTNSGNYTNRSLKLPEMIDHNDLVYRVFTKYGWKWGGDYKSLKDYQHFYREGILNSNILKLKS